MPFQIETGETLREAILRTRNERLDKAIAALLGKPQPSAEAIHDARREFKRLRSLVRLVRGSMDKPVRAREAQALGNAGRALAQSRDAAALLETVEKIFGTLMPEDRKSRRISAEGQKLLQQIREELCDHAERRLDPLEMKATVKLLRDMKRRVWFANSPPPAKMCVAVGKSVWGPEFTGGEVIYVFD